MSDYVFQNKYGVVAVFDKDKMDEPKDIRFIYPDYQEKFRIPDGDQILVSYPTGERKTFVCKYIDDYHVLIGRNAFHICEFAERMQAIHAHVAPFPEKRIVWSNRDLDLKDWINDLREQFPNENREQWYNRMVEINNEYFEDERANLDCHVGEDIIGIADYEYWYGRSIGYKEYHSDKLRDCLDVLPDCEFNEWYVDRDGEFRSTQTNHDGTHHIYYRRWKPGITEEQRANLISSILIETVTQTDIDSLTDKLGKAVGTVYGWEFPTEQKERVSARDAR